ncbi:MAG: DoxX family protein [Akkermansiaceae bacterium]|nr:DoxX family protein [Armatimonadota bacterium]
MKLTAKQKRVVYWVGTGLFCLMFLYSAVWTLIDLPGAIEEFQHLEYPWFVPAPLAIAKILGVIAILTNKSRTLKEFAFAGFLFDLLLAALGHYFHPGTGTGIGVAIFGMVLWIYAYVADRQLRATGTIETIPTGVGTSTAESAP